MSEDWPPGTIRYPDTRGPGTWVVACPRDALYSLATMLATEFWQDGQWKPMWADDDEQKSLA